MSDFYEEITLRKSGFTDLTLRKVYGGGYEMLTHTRRDGTKIWTKITFTDEEIEKQTEMYQVKPRFRIRHRCVGYPDQKQSETIIEANSPEEAESLFWDSHWDLNTFIVRTQDGQICEPVS